MAESTNLETLRVKITQAVERMGLVQLEALMEVIAALGESATEEGGAHCDGGE